MTQQNAKYIGCADLAQNPAGIQLTMDQAEKIQSMLSNPPEPRYTIAEIVAGLRLEWVNTEDGFTASTPCGFFFVVPAANGTGWIWDAPATKPGLCESGEAAQEQCLVRLKEIVESVLRKAVGCRDVA